MRIAITGASGLIGTAIRDFFVRLNYEVVILKRKPSGNYEFHPSDFDQVKAVINLAGESVFKRWTNGNKKKIKDSRILTSKALSETLSKLTNPPEVVVNASAIGYYGNGKEKTFNEESAPGHDFLAEVVTEWEKALNIPKVRTVFARFGVVLSHKGGALKTMLLPFKLGLGGRIGSGKQFMSWIDLDDVVGAIHHIVNDITISGPVNVVSPHPIRNEEFTKELGKVLNRPTVLPMPEFAIRLLLGEMGEDLLLSSARVEPKVLLETGYPFLFSNLASALKKEVHNA
jgi:uncharacterized protein (TIGR01777 family)